LSSAPLCDKNIADITRATPNSVESKCRSFNKSVDVYAFGLLLWEILSKETPFKMLDVTEIRRRVIAGERPRLQSYGSPKITSLITSSW
jgi:serine/threonine protein kinase